MLEVRAPTPHGESAPLGRGEIPGEPALHNSGRAVPQVHAATVPVWFHAAVRIAPGYGEPIQKSPAIDQDGCFMINNVNTIFIHVTETIPRTLLPPPPATNILYSLLILIIIKNITILFWKLSHRRIIVMVHHSPKIHLYLVSVFTIQYISPVEFYLILLSRSKTLCSTPLLLPFSRLTIINIVFKLSWEVQYLKN